MTDMVKMQGIFEQGYGTIAKKPMKDKKLNVISKAIYAYICSYTGKGEDAFPSQKLICNDLGISKDTLAKYMKELKDSGYVTVVQHKEKGKFAQNLYTVNIIPCMVSSDTVRADTETIGYGQVDTNNNNITNNIKINNNNINNNNINNNTHTAEENDPPLIQQILKNYKELELPEYEYRPDNYVILEAYNNLGAKKLLEALKIMSESEFVKNNLSINTIFKLDNLKKALNGNFKDKKKKNEIKEIKIEEKKEEKAEDYYSEEVLAALKGADYAKM